MLYASAFKSCVEDGTSSEPPSSIFLGRWEDKSELQLFSSAWLRSICNCKKNTVACSVLNELNCFWVWWIILGYDKLAPYHNYICIMSFPLHFRYYMCGKFPTITTARSGNNSYHLLLSLGCVKHLTQWTYTPESHCARLKHKTKLTIKPWDKSQMSLIMD